jgi:hypothetical protein
MYFILVKRSVNTAFRIDAFIDLEGQASRHDWGVTSSQTIGRGPVAAAKLKHVPESAGRYKGTAVTLALQDSIGGNSRSVDNCT